MLTISKLGDAKAKAPARERVTAQCRACAQGITLTVEDSGKCLQASAHLEAKDMDEYALADGDDTLCFRVSLPLFIDCISIFGFAKLGATSLSLSCDADSDGLHLLLEEDGVVTECELRTLVGEESDVDYVSLFRSSPVVNKAIIKSARLREAFAELSDVSGAATVALRMSPQDPAFRMEAVGALGSVFIDFAAQSDSFVVFESSAEQKMRYRLTFLQHAFRALPTASETYLRINEDGLLCVQHMIVTDAGAQNFVDFVVLPAESDAFDGQEEGESDGDPAERGAPAQMFE